jgi:septin 2
MLRLCDVFAADNFFLLGIFLFFSFKSIVQYIDSQYEKYLQDESGLNRRNIVDSRVHCCFYFINPSNRGYVSSGKGFLVDKYLVSPVRYQKASDLYLFLVLNLKC